MKFDILTMGFLDFQNDLTFEYPESKGSQRKLKIISADIFLRLFKRFKDYSEPLGFARKFGYEIEMHTLKKKTEIDGTHYYILENDTKYLKEKKYSNFSIIHEYGTWMIEGVPNHPFEDYISGDQMLKSMRGMLSELETSQKEDNVVLWLPFIPQLGHKVLYRHIDILKAPNIYSNSKYMHDSFIYEHARFYTFTQNVRLRRGENPNINLPLFVDTNTNSEEIQNDEISPGQVHLDSFTFGMGLCSLQLTFGVENFDEARWLYDQFHIFTPLLVKVILIALACTFGIYSNNEGQTS